MTNRQEELKRLVELKKRKVPPDILAKAWDDYELAKRAEQEQRKKAETQP